MNLSRMMIFAEWVFRPNLAPRRSSKHRVGKRKRRKRFLKCGRRRGVRYKERDDFLPCSLDERFTDFRHKWLHILNFAEEFSSMCKSIKDFDLLFGADPLMMSTYQHRDDYGLLLEVAGKSVPSYDSLFKFRGLYLSTNRDNEIPIVFDTGATVNVTPCRSDFLSFTTDRSTLNGITAQAPVLGYGKVRWEVYDDSGRRHFILTTAYYVPDARLRLFSPQEYIHQHPTSKFVISHHASYFKFPKCASKLTFRLHNGVYTPTLLPLAFPHTSPIAANVTADSNINLTTAQKELLQWHFRLGHFNLRWIQRLTRVREGEKEPVLPTKTKASSCQVPLCAACQFGKMHRRTEGAVIQEKVDEKDGSLKVNHLRPGQVVSADQFVSKLPGRLSTSRGREREEEKYSGGTIYVDHASSYVHVNNQVLLTAAETIRGKHQFERELLLHGVNVLAYRGDNGVFKAAEFMRDLELKGQTIEFAGVGAHHQNGIAERAIRTISESARTMLIHAAIHWNEETALERESEGNGLLEQSRKVYFYILCSTYVLHD